MSLTYSASLSLPNNVNLTDLDLLKHIKMQKTYPGRERNKLSATHKPKVFNIFIKERWRAGLTASLKVKPVRQYNDCLKYQYCGRLTIDLI